MLTQFLQRIEPYGWDRHDRTYFVLDDNRLYRLTEAPPPKPKRNTKKARAAQRASKRRRVSAGAGSDAGDEASEAGAPAEPEDDGLGGMKWECVAVTLDEVRQFLSTIQKSKDPNEKVLRDQIQDHLVPILEKQEESRKRKQQQRERELLNLEKLAHAKRSSRIASRLERQRLEEQAREEERKRREEEEARRKEELRRIKMERERDNRLMSREQRLREREARRRRHEEELAQLSDTSRAASNASARMSERRRQAEIERNKKALEELEAEDDDWIFDCVCGVYGQVDDGTHSVACERCNTWQHSKCLGINEEEADRDDFHFVCDSCRRREQAANESRPRIIKIKVNRQQQSGSPPRERPADAGAPPPAPQAQSQLAVELQPGPSPAPPGSSDQPRAVPGEGVQEVGAAQSAQQATPRPLQQDVGSGSSSDAVSEPPRAQPRPPSGPQGSNPFSSPHPTLLPPDRQPAKPSNAHGLPPGHDDGQPGLADEKVASSAALSTLAGSGSGTSPSKQPHRPSPPQTKTALAPPAASNGIARPGSAGKVSSITPSSISLLQLTPAQSREARPDAGSSPLPPPSGGLSPIKQSPPVPQQQHVNGGPHHAAAPPTAAHPPAAVFPPAAALSPSPPQQILTPPVKPAEPARMPAQQPPQGVQAPKPVQSAPSQADSQPS